MALDNHILIFNLDKTFNLFNLSAKQFDTDNARSFTFQFIQNNTPFSLNDINVKVGGVKPDGKKIFNDVQIIDSTNGIVELDLTSQMLAANGVLKLEFIFMKDNIRLSSYPFEINIVPSVTNFNAVISSDEFEALTNALGSVEGTINNLTTKVNNAITNVTANQIGGTNLLTGTQWFDYGWVLGENGVDAKIDRTNLFQGCAVEVLWYDWNYFYQNVNYEVGKTYTISCYAKCDNPGANIYFSLADNMTACGMQKLTTEWRRYVFTFTPTLSTGSLRIECSGVSDNNKAYVSKIKLEKGTMATDYSPNPFDWQSEVGNGVNLISSSNCIFATDKIAFPTRLKPNTMYTLNMGDLRYDGSCLDIYKSSDDYTKSETKPLQNVIEWANIRGIITFETNSTIPDNEDLNFVFWCAGINKTFPTSNKKIKLEEGRISTPFCESVNINSKQIESCRNDINNNTKQIASNSNAIQDIKNSWISTGNNNLCINGRSELDVYPGGVYFITGTSVTELHTITHSHLLDGQSVFFIAETIDQTANIKFCHDDLSHCYVYTPAGKDFWITGRDNGDTIFEMKKMGGVLRFVGMR
ncbi:BppU family phage baseplate upper protein [Clostridium thermobutyricum]|uniref:BppU family phage baseplate upper protein n=1 Tax=Clostridium thermobutyricum TaxID=29372 RepID=UPI0018A9DFF5|nr:BppU family phage baseplate upper protein [Clostridium thermobutyricum]